MAIETLTSFGTSTDIGVERAAVILGQIADVAHRADRLCYHVGGSMDGDIEALSLEWDRLRDVICQVGFLADVASKELGRVQNVARGANAEDWMLPPVYPKSSGG